MTASDAFLRLRNIPTFTLVDPNGVPFMILDQGGRSAAVATGYFFMSLETALGALQDAREKDKQAGAEEIWKNARVAVIP